MAMTPKQMISLLEKNGFKIVNQKGSHVKLKNDLNNKTTTVPLHCKDLKIGLEKAIKKQAGLEE